MPRREHSETELEQMERRRLLVLSRKAIERSQLLVRGSKELLQRSRHNHETARELRRELGARRKAT